MIDEIQVFLKDKKEEMPLTSKGTSILRIMKFFSSDNKDMTDLENPKYNQDIYEILGWKNADTFDVISSFWTIFACAVIQEVSDNKEYSYLKQHYSFPDYKKYFTPRIPGGKRRSEHANGKRFPSFPQKYLEPRPKIVSIVNSTIRSYPKLNELAALTHSVANFMPCPSSPYNSAKGLVKKTHDFFPLFIDKIDDCCEQGMSITFELHKQGSVEVNKANIETLLNWRKWLIFSREKYCLEDYYYIYTDKNNTEHIKGIPFFKSQNLSNPLPRMESEIEECLDEMVKRIRTRAFRLSEHQHNKGT